MKTKKSSLLILSGIVLLLAMSATSFANPIKIISEEGIGFEVFNPNSFKMIQEDNLMKSSTQSIIEGEKVLVSGGYLWATWRNGIDFRANYDHATETHRCTAMNDTGWTERSEWTSAGMTAISPWVDQTLWGNKVFAATK